MPKMLNIMFNSGFSAGYLSKVHNTSYTGQQLFLTTAFMITNWNKIRKFKV